MNRVIKRLGKTCLGLGVLLLPALGFSQDEQVTSGAADAAYEFENPRSVGLGAT